MLPDVTYADYAECGGEADEGKFNASLIHAKAAVRDIIGFNEPRNEREEKAYRAAVCAAVDVDLRHGGSGGIGEGGGSYTIGSYSHGSAAVSSAKRNNYDIDMARAIKPHLVGTSLLYQVIL